MNMPFVDLVESRRRQTTVARPAVIHGWSAADFRPCVAELRPAPADQGVVFEIGDERIAVAARRLPARGPTHTTTLVGERHKVVTVEHFLAAVAAFGCDNLTVRLGDGGLPVPDFSALGYAAALDRAGLAEWPARRLVLKIRRPFRMAIADDDRFAEISPTDDDRLHLHTTTVFEPPIGTMAASFDEGSTDFAGDLAWARSFVPRALDSAGTRWRRVRERYPCLPEDPRDSPLVAFSAAGFVTPLVRPDEPGRHKLVDLLGDLTLAGHRIAGKITVFKPGHSFNALIATRLRREAGLLG